MKRKTILIDSPTFIWGVPKAGEASEPEKDALVDALFEKMAQLDCDVLVPTPQLTEMFTGCKTERHRDALDAVIDRPEFDTASTTKSIAILCGEMTAPIWREARRQEALAGKPPQRQVISFDMLLIATALQEGAHLVVSNDPSFKQYQNATTLVLTISEAVAQMDEWLAQPQQA